MEKIIFHSIYWIILSAGFFFMAIDEGWTIHEWAGKFFLPRHGFLLFSWILAFIPLVAFLFIFFLKFLIDLPRRTSLLFLLAGTFYVGGAIGFESISAYFFENFGLKSIQYNLTTTIEEGLEMTGLVIFIYSLLQYMNLNYHRVRLNFYDQNYFKSISGK